MEVTFHSLAMCLISIYPAESDGEIILKIGQHLAKLSARVECSVFVVRDRIMPLRKCQKVRRNVHSFRQNTGVLQTDGEKWYNNIAHCMFRTLSHKENF